MLLRWEACRTSSCLGNAEPTPHPVPKLRPVLVFRSSRHMRPTIMRRQNRRRTSIMLATRLSWAVASQRDAVASGLP